MTTSSLYSHSGSLATSTSSVPFIAGIGFQATSGIVWLQGYWWYAGGAISPQKFALWCVTGGTTYGGGIAGSVVPGSTVTSGTLTANAWNYVPLPSPVPLSVGCPYVAATGLTINGAFAAVNNQFSSGGPYGSGLASGALLAFGDSTAGGTNGNPWGGWPNGLFATGQGTDPAAYMPRAGSNSANFGIDVQVSDAAPPGFTGPWTFYPSATVARPPTTPDAAAPYGVAVEGLCTAPARLTGIMVYSPAAATVLPAWCGAWDVATQQCVAENLAPPWSGGIGSGWVQSPVAPVTLVPGRRYRFQVNVTTNSVAVAKDAGDPWGPSGALRNGIAAGPVTAVPLSNASSAYNYNNNPGGTPPYSDGTLLAHGQSVFSQTVAGWSGRPPFPVLWANGGGGGSGTQDYLVSPVCYSAAGSALMLGGIV